MYFEVEDELRSIFQQELRRKDIDFIHLTQYIDDQYQFKERITSSKQLQFLSDYMKINVKTGVLGYDFEKYKLQTITSVKDLISQRKEEALDTENEESCSFVAFQELLDEIKVLEEATQESESRKSREYVEDLSVELFYKIKKVQELLDSFKQMRLMTESIYNAEGYSDRPRKKYFYRGHGCLNYQLIPKVFRSKKHLENEHNLYKEIQVRNADRFLTGSGRLELLTTMQHYGLPTRLLDITASPLVALYFAVSEEKDHHRDGELIVFNMYYDKIKYFDSDTVEILTALSTLTSYEKLELAKVSLNALKEYIENVLEERRKRPHQIELITESELEKIIQKYNTYPIVKKLNNEVEKEYGIHLGEINPFDLFSVVPVQPKQTNERIIRQQGAFIAYGLMGEKVARKLTERYMYKERGKIVKYIIPAENKKDILLELESLGINAATIYPELDKVADYLQSKL